MSRISMDNIGQLPQLLLHNLRNWYFNNLLNRSVNQSLLIARRECENNIQHEAWLHGFDRSKAPITTRVSGLCKQKAIACVKSGKIHGQRVHVLLHDHWSHQQLFLHLMHRYIYNLMAWCSILATQGLWDVSSQNPILRASWHSLHFISSSRALTKHKTFFAIMQFLSLGYCVVPMTRNVPENARQQQKVIFMTYQCSLDYMSKQSCWVPLPLQFLMSATSWFDMADMGPPGPPEFLFVWSFSPPVRCTLMCLEALPALHLNRPRRCKKVSMERSSAETILHVLHRPRSNCLALVSIKDVVRLGLGICWVPLLRQHAFGTEITSSSPSGTGTSPHRHSNW